MVSCGSKSDHDLVRCAYLSVNHESFDIEHVALYSLFQGANSCSNDVLIVSHAFRSLEV